MNIRKKCAALAALLLLSVCVSACGKKVENTVHSLDDIAGKTVGVIASTPGEESVERNAEHDACTVERYFDSDDLADDLLDGDVDCAVVDDDTADKLTSRYHGLKRLSKPYSDQGYRIAFPKGSSAMQQLVGESLERMRKDGTLDSVISGWMSGDGYEFEEAELPDDAETVIVGVNMGAEPYEYDDATGTAVGLEIDIIRYICRDLGVKYELRDGSGQQLIYLVESGKVSFAVGRILQSDSADADYTDTYLTDQQFVVVRK